MQRMTGLAISALALVALSGGAAFAQAPAGGPPSGGDMIAQFDTNHDGALSASEIQAMRQAQFARADANHDGFISQDELPQGGPNAARMASMFTTADTNHDGKLSQSEFMAQPSGMLEHFDANHDGALSADEIAAMRAAMQARINGGGN